MKANVQSVEAKGSYDGKYGLMYKYEVHIGEHVGEYSSKKYATKEAEGFPFIIGSEAEYEYEAHEKYPKIKTVSNWSGGSGYAKKSSNTSFGVSYCKDLIVAGKLDIKDWQEASEKIINFMNKLDNK